MRKPPTRHEPLEKLLEELLCVLKKPARPIQITVRCVHQGASVEELRAVLDPIRKKLRAVAKKFPKPTK
jgi:hypothetical protein